jgi:hypothetical protein
MALSALAITAIAGGGAGLGLQLKGQYEAGKAAQAQAETQQAILNQEAETRQAIAAHNAEIARRQAEDEREAARVAAEKFEKEGERLRGTQRVQIGRGGVLATEGTPALLLEETAQELEQERLDILKEGFRRGEFLESQAVGLEFRGATEARSLRFQGAAARTRGINIARGTRLASVGTLLTGAGQTAFRASQLRKGRA